MKIQLFGDTTQTLDTSLMTSPYGASLTNYYSNTTFNAVVQYTGSAAVTTIGLNTVAINFVDPNLKMYDWGYMRPAGKLYIQEATTTPGILPFGEGQNNMPTIFNIAYYNGQYVLKQDSSAAFTLQAGVVYNVWIENLITA